MLSIWLHSLHRISSTKSQLISSIIHILMQFAIKSYSLRMQHLPNSLDLSAFSTFLDEGGYIQWITLKLIVASCSSIQA